MPLKSVRACFTKKKMGELEMLRTMVLDESCDVDKHNEKYLTPLHVAAKYGQLDCVEVLLKRGANPNRQSPKGTPLHLAAAKGHLKCFEMLIKHGGLALARDKKGKTPLNRAEDMNQEEIIHYIARSLCGTTMKDSSKSDGITNSENISKGESENNANGTDPENQIKDSKKESDMNQSSRIVSIPIPEILPADLEMNENCKYCIGEKTMSIMGKLNERTVMIKKYHETASEHESCQLFSYELNTIRSLYHPNIALLIAVCRGSKPLEQCLVFEPLAYRYLHRLLFEDKVKLPEDSVLKLACDVANAMQYIHNMGFLHCYLGSQSVMVTRDYTAKVCNFEYSLREESGPVSLSHCSLLHNWMAPEQILGFPADKPGDVFSFGVLVWECLILKRSRQLFTLHQLAVIGKSLHSRSLSKVGGKNSIKLLISDCTRIASKRPTFHQIFTWLDGLLHCRLVNVAPVSMDKDVQLPKLFS